MMGHRDCLLINKCDEMWFGKVMLNLKEINAGSLSDQQVCKNSG